MAGVADSLRGLLTVPPSVRGARVRTYTGLSALLTGLLVFAVPVGAVAVGLPVGPLLVAAAGVYVLAVVLLDAAFEGLCVALVVTAVFNTRAAIELPDPVGGQLRLVSVLAVATAGLFVLDGGLSRQWLRRPDRALVVGAFAVFVLWGALAAAAGNGPRPVAAALYVAEQSRYLCLLVLSALAVDRTDPESVVVPLTFGLGATLVFAVDEVFAGRGGYLADLGSVGLEIARLWPSPSLTSFPRGATVLYEGGAFGQNRTMVGLATVFVPIVIAAATRSRRHAPLALASLFGLVSIVASSSHAAIAALYAGLLPVGIYVLFLAADRAGLERARRLVVPLSVAGIALAVGAVLLATAAGADRILLVRTNNLGVRLQQYAAAIDVAARYPLVGVGGGRNVAAVAGTAVHNVFLHHLAATGVPGFLAYVTSLAGATGLCLWRCLDADAVDRWCWVGVLGGLLAFYVYGFWVVASRWELLNAAHWLLVGVVVGADGCPARLRTALGRLRP